MKTKILLVSLMLCCMAGASVPVKQESECCSLRQAVFTLAADLDRDANKASLNSASMQPGSDGQKYFVAQEEAYRKTYNALLDILARYTLPSEKTAHEAMQPAAIANRVAQPKKRSP